MKTLMAVSALALLCASPQDSRPTANDRELVEKAARGYVDAFYDVKPELLDGCVHPELKKIGFWRASPDQEYRLMPMSFDQLKSLAGRWNADGSSAGDDAPREVEILDLLDQTAAVKVTAVWGIDYMQIGKFDGKWQIMHVLWQSHPPEEK